MADNDPTFVVVDLTELQDEGVLFHANEQFFWPLGLALTWDYDKETGKATSLHIRTWQFADGHIETIEDDGSPPTPERRARFLAWMNNRVGRLPAEERGGMVNIYAKAQKGAGVG